MKKSQFWVVRENEEYGHIPFGSSTPVHVDAKVVIKSADGEEIAGFAPDMVGVAYDIVEAHNLCFFSK